MREGLVFTGLMAAVVIAAAAISVASPDLLRTQHGPNNPGIIEFPRSGPSPAPAIGTSLVAPAPLEVMPPSVASIPSPIKSAYPRPSTGSPGSQPGFTPPVPNPPPPGDDCPTGLILDHLLGICVVI